MESGLEFALFLVVIILIVGPVLAIAAFVRVNHIRELFDQVPKLTARIFDLERKISALEKASQAGSAATAAKSDEALPKPPEGIPQPAVLSPLPTPPPSSVAVPSVPIWPQTSPHAASPRQISPLTLASTAASRPDSDVETMIAGHWFYYVGILALAVAVAFFLKYAFDNDWIGPTGRVAIGLLIGSALFPVSQWILGRGYTYFSEGITGLGTAILYLSIWAGWHYYALFGQTPAFVMMMVVTAVSTAVAIARDSQRIAVLALIGGVLTPTLVIAWRRAWKVLPPLLFVSTLFYFWAWYGEFYAPDELVTTLAFGTLFFAVFAALPAIQSLREGALTEIPDVILVAANALQFLVALRQMLWPAHRWGLTFAALALAAAHLLAERSLPEKAKSQVQTTRMLYAGLA